MKTTFRFANVISVGLGVLLGLGAFLVMMFGMSRTSYADQRQEAEALIEGEFSAKCTAVYVGKEVAEDGRMIVARSEDQFTGAYNKLFTVVEADTGTGKKITDTGKGQNNFSVAIPDTTYKYTTLLDASYYDDGAYYASCINEYGLAVTATVTTSISGEYGIIDPLKPAGQGLREAIMAAIPACQAKSAEEGVKVFARYVDTYGSVEACTLLFSDKTEAWIFEIYGGTTYAAMRLPQDKVAVIGNQVMLEWIDFEQSDGYVVSANLKEVLDALEDPVIDEEGRYHLARCVTGSARGDYANMRTWRGQQLWAPSVTGDYVSGEFYSLLFTPDKKISLFDVIALYGDRYEGTPFDLSIPGNEYYYPIGIETQGEVHIVQTFEELPDCCCKVQWLSMGNGEDCIFVPAFSGITETYEKYRVDNTSATSVNDSFYYVCRRNAALAETDREYLASGVKEFNHAQEQAMYEKIVQVAKIVATKYAESEEQGSRYVTDLGKSMAEQQYFYARALYDQLTYVQLYNGNDFFENIYFKADVSGIKSVDTDNQKQEEKKETDTPEKFSLGLDAIDRIIAEYGIVPFAIAGTLLLIILIQMGIIIKMRRSRRGHFNF